MPKLHRLSGREVIALLSLFGFSALLLARRSRKIMSMASKPIDIAHLSPAQHEALASIVEDTGVTMAELTALAHRKSLAIDAFIDLYNASLRNEIQAGIDSGLAGPLDVEDIKRRGRQRLAQACTETTS